MRAAASCPQGQRCPGMPPSDASGSSKANKSFPAGRSCRVLLALCPPTASTFRNIRRTIPPVLRALAERRQSPAPFPGFRACSAQRPAFAAAAHSQRLRIFAPFSAAPYRPRRRTLRLIPRLAASPCFCIPPFACNFSLFTKPPPASYCLSGFFSIYSLAGKIITFNLFVRLT